MLPTFSAITFSSLLRQLHNWPTLPPTYLYLPNKHMYKHLKPGLQSRVYIPILSVCMSTKAPSDNNFSYPI